MSFAPGLTDRQMRVVYRWLRDLDQPDQRGDPAVSPFASMEPFVHEYLFHARIGNLRDPRSALRALLAELTEAGARVKDSFFACWEWRQGGVMGPRRDPRAPAETSDFPDARRYLDSLWSPEADPPPSEVDSDLKGGLLSEDELVLEHRGSPLFFQGFRIAYGIAPFTRAPGTATGVSTTSQGQSLAGASSEGASAGVRAGRDLRTTEVRTAVVEALIDGWRTLFKSPGRSHVRPQPLAHDGTVDAIDRIVCGTRVGYLFTVESAQLLDRPSPGSCRFREYELMEAVLTAVTRLGLAPVVNWRRFGTPMVMPPIKLPETIDIQIWEPEGDHSSHPDLDHLPSPGVCS